MTIFTLTQVFNLVYCVNYQNGMICVEVFVFTGLQSVANTTEKSPTCALIMSC